VASAESAKVIPCIKIEDQCSSSWRCCSRQARVKEKPIKESKIDRNLSAYLFLPYCSSSSGSRNLLELRWARQEMHYSTRIDYALLELSF
jgi:hypothetical protein